MNKTLAILRDALDLLSHGERWTKGQSVAMIEGKTHYCIWGAMATVALAHQATKYQPVGDFIIVAEAALVAQLPESCAIASTPYFNDQLSTTWEDVELLFKKAINAEEE